MHAVVVSLGSTEQMDMLYPRMQQAFGQIAGYRLGRRFAGGPVHIAEGRFKRLHPEYLLRAAVLLLIAPAALMVDMVDGVLDVVARLDDPTGAKVEVISLVGAPEKTAFGSAGQ